jgi:hypothetical protein
MRHHCRKAVKPPPGFATDVSLRSEQRDEASNDREGKNAGKERVPTHALCRERIDDQNGRCPK